MTMTAVSMLKRVQHLSLTMTTLTVLELHVSIVKLALNDEKREDKELDDILSEIPPKPVQ